MVVHLNLSKCLLSIFLFILCTKFLWLWQNKEVTDAIQKVAAAYDCKIVEGVLSHQLKQFVIDGNKVVLSVPSGETRVDDAEFEENEVYAVDIVTSTGDGKVSLDMNELCFSPILFCVECCISYAVV